MPIGDIQKQGGGENITLEAFKRTEESTKIELKAEQQESQQGMLLENEERINPFAAKFATKRKESIKPQSRVMKAKEMAEKGQRLLPIEQIKDSAGHFNRHNPELEVGALVALREEIKPGDSVEDILNKVRKYYSDPSLADEALDFLLETTDGELNLAVQTAKEELNKQLGREITAGRNIGARAREAASRGLGTPTNLRDLYRDITGNPRESTTLFEELSQKYNYEDLKKVIDFLLHSMGADLKSKGTSIPRGQLHTLITEVRSLQAIVGVYRFFESRMPLVEKMFQNDGGRRPEPLTKITISREFINLVKERYPSPEKAVKAVDQLGVKGSVPGEITVLTQMRDAVRQMSPGQIYRSLQHRDDLYMAIIEALEDLEDKLEDLESQPQDLE